MPLHLLGKKSWNVYNPAAIAKVRQDEEAHEAREAAREQRDQEVDAARRLAFLRGETPPPLALGDTPSQGGASKESIEGLSWDKDERRKRRKLKGEDDTARDIRLAREGQDRGTQAKERLQSQVPLHDDKGNIQLFAPPPTKSDESRARSADEGPRFADAGGYERRAPWYIDSAERKRKNAFGRDDEGRKSRDDQRLAKGDPLAAMRGAQAALKSKREEEKRASMKREKDHRHRPGKRYGADDDDLEGFSLDAPARRDPRDDSNHRRRRSRSPRRTRDERRYSRH